VDTVLLPQEIEGAQDEDAPTPAPAEPEEVEADEDEAAPTCGDVTPPGGYSCAQQVEFGKCDAEWMVSGEYCQ